jgi:hypothetical protein
VGRPSSPRPPLPRRISHSGDKPAGLGAVEMSQVSVGGTVTVVSDDPLRAQRDRRRAGKRREKRRRTGKKSSRSRILGRQRRSSAREPGSRPCREANSPRTRRSGGRSRSSRAARAGSGSSPLAVSQASPVAGAASGCRLLPGSSAALAAGRDPDVAVLDVEAPGVVPALARSAGRRSRVPATAAAGAEAVSFADQSACEEDARSGLGVDEAADRLAQLGVHASGFN